MRDLIAGMELVVVVPGRELNVRSMSIPPSKAPYPIGIPGTPWGADEKREWLAGQHVRRSYAREVIAPLEARLPARAELFQYGALDYAPLGLGVYPLLAVRSREWHPDQPVVLITGGVHGYETSGVQGALQWLEQDFDVATETINLLVLPCISPWGYETINRWNPHALDPNRQFKPGSPAAEAALAMAFVAAQGGRVDVHVDLHETTDTDNSEFGPAKAARDGVAFVRHAIPDGFYLVGDSERSEPGFQRALIEAVRPVTPIAKPDEHGRLIGATLQQEGVVHLALRSSGLCGGMTTARFVTTTEVYPDSASTSPAECNDAQVAAVRGAIAHLQRS
ncbi:MAG: M14 family metallocarboxypeptidase, partial [Caldimonas sp.]